MRRGLDRAVGVEVDPAGGRAGAGGQAGGDHLRVLDRGAVEDRRQHLVELVGRDAHDRRLPVDQLLLDHLDGDADGGDAGPLAVAGLEHEDLAVLDRELEVLHVLEMLLEDLRGCAPAPCSASGMLLVELGDGLGRAHAGDDVLALGVDQEFAVEHLFAGGRIAGEGDAGTGRFAGVAVDHGLHVDRGAPFLGNVVLAAIDDRAVVHPGAEDGADGALRAGPTGCSGNSLPVRSLTRALKRRDQLLQVVHRELRVLDVPVVVALVLERLDDGLKRLVVLARALLHARGRRRRTSG